MKDIIQPGNMVPYEAAIQAMVRQAQAVGPPKPRKEVCMSVRSRSSRRVSRRDRARARSRQEKQEKLKELAYSSARGAWWSVLFFGLMVSLVTTLVAFLLGESVYAVLGFVFGLVVGAALLKWESA
jgi:hypothetical protein